MMEHQSIFQNSTLGEHKNLQSRVVSHAFLGFIWLHKINKILIPRDV